MFLNSVMLSLKTELTQLFKALEPFVVLWRGGGEVIRAMRVGRAYEGDKICKVEIGI